MTRRRTLVLVPEYPLQNARAIIGAIDMVVGPDDVGATVRFRTTLTGKVRKIIISKEEEA